MAQVITQSNANQQKITELEAKLEDYDQVTEDLKLKLAIHDSSLNQLNEKGEKDDIDKRRTHLILRGVSERTYFQPKGACKETPIAPG